MQIANGTVILSPENQQIKHGITPAEALILYRLHRTNANGTPLGNFFIQPGEALTIDVEAKPAEEEYFNQHTGRHVSAKAAVAAKTHPRTKQEEISRLKRKYTGNITQGGVAKTAFVATFGDSINPQIPETFAEIEELTGHIFHDAGETPAGPEDPRKVELMKMRRADLCALAVDQYKIKVKVGDDTGDIVDAIIDAQEKIAAKAAEKAAEEAA